MKKPDAISIRLLCLFTLGLILLTACGQPQQTGSGSVDSQGYRQAFAHYIQAGNAEYARKDGFASFRRSLVYFDSAESVAEASRDTLMMADAIFARGRVYDAWNKEPLKTVQCFETAAALLQTQASVHYPEYVYLRQLVAHGYEKMNDTVHAVAVLRQLFRELVLLPSAVRDSLHSIPEMTLIATKVGAWQLADSVLDSLVRRELVRNDTATYDYLDHYYLARARLDVFRSGQHVSPYLDSLALVYQSVHNPVERIYYSSELYNLYAAAGDYERAFRYLETNKLLDDTINDRGELSQLQQAMIASEVKAGHRQLIYESRLSKGRAVALCMALALLLIITVLAVYLYRRNKKYKLQSERLNELNDELDTKVTQVEILNKEIQHRVKNNLSMVYGLLYLQERSATTPEAVADLQTARMRVESIALLHGQLQTGNHGLDLTDFIRNMVTAVGSCFATGARVSTDLSIETVKLPANSLQAISLILNEWVTNAIKYAVSEGEELVLTVHVRKENKGVFISFSDNGTKDHSQDTPGLGTQIVQLLCKQLHAKLVKPEGEPYHYELWVPDEL